MPRRSRRRSVPVSSRRSTRKRGRSNAKDKDEDKDKDNVAAVRALSAPASHPIWRVSHPGRAQAAARRYLGTSAVLYLSTSGKHKYMVRNPATGGWVHFGHMDYEDFTHHRDLARRQRYLRRATAIRGTWRRHRYSPNQLAIHVLW